MSQHDFDLIESFLEGRLKAAELEAFEAKRQSSDEFEALISEVADLQLGVERAALSARMEGYHQGILTKKKNTLPSYWAAAAISLLVVVAGAWMVWGQKSEGEKLYAAYYHADPGLVTTMSGGDEYEFNRAMVDYKSGNYREAGEAFRLLLVAQPYNDTLQYFLAMTELNLGDEEAAKELLLQVSQDSDGIFYKDSFWYLGLLEIKAGNHSLAKEYLEKSDYPEYPELVKAIEQLPQ